MLAYDGTSGQLAPIRLTFASLRSGEFNTSDFPGFQGEDGNSWLSSGSAEDDPELVSRMPQSVMENGAWLSFTEQDKSVDHVIHLPPPPSEYESAV